MNFRMRENPIIDAELSEYLAEKDLNLSASADLKASVKGADYDLCRRQRIMTKKQISSIRHLLRR